MNSSSYCHFKGYRFQCQYLLSILIILTVILTQVVVKPRYKLWALVVGTKTVTFFLGYHVRKPTASPPTNKIPPHHKLNSPTSAAYYAFYLWVRSQRGLDVTTSNLNIYMVPTCSGSRHRWSSGYHTRLWIRGSRVRSERKNPEYDFLRMGSKAVGPVS